MPHPALRLLLAFALSAAFFPASGRSITEQLAEEPAMVEHTSAAQTRAALTASGMHAVEGIYAFGADGAVIAVMRAPGAPTATLYRIIILSSPDRSVRPGAIAGLLTPGGRADQWDAALYTSVSPDGCLGSPKRFTVSASDACSRLAFERVRSAFSFEPQQLLPYMIRRTLRRNRGRSGAATAGCTRIFPSPASPASPCYL